MGYIHVNCRDPDRITCTNEDCMHYSYAYMGTSCFRHRHFSLKWSLFHNDLNHSHGYIEKSDLRVCYACYSLIGHSISRISRGNPYYV